MLARRGKSSGQAKNPFRPGQMNGLVWPNAHAIQLYCPVWRLVISNGSASERGQGGQNGQSWFVSDRKPFFWPQFNQSAVIFSKSPACLSGTGFSPVILNRA